MCLAIPARVTALNDANSAEVEVGGIHKQVDISLLPGLAPGDYVIVHVGYALSRIDEDEAKKTLALFAEMSEQMAAEEGDNEIHR